MFVTETQEPPVVDAQGEAHPSTISALTACQTLSGKTLENATLTTTLVEATKAAPTYCKVSGTIAPKLNFEIRLPDAWNGKLYYGGGGGYPQYTRPANDGPAFELATNYVCTAPQLP